MDADAIVQACLALGFARAGIAPALPSARGAVVSEWLAQGKHGEMGYLAEQEAERLDVRRLVPGARAVIVVADQYAARGSGESTGQGGRLPIDGRSTNPPPAPPSGRGADRARIAKYALGRDYHRVIDDRLKVLVRRLRALEPGETFRAFVDTSAVLEREHAARALGGGSRAGAFIGKHTLLIDPELGSYLLLGGVVTTMDLAGDVSAKVNDVASACGSCTRCIDACPTGAITPWSVDARRCVSYLTLEHKGAIEPALFAGMGRWVAGCDVCQDVCPFNQGDGDQSLVNPAYEPRSAAGRERVRLKVLDVLKWTEEDRRRVLAGSSAKRVSLEMARRNAVIAAGNVIAATANVELLGEVRRVAESGAEGAVVRGTAREVVAGVMARAGG